MTRKQVNTSKSKTSAVKNKAKKDARIRVQDLFNSYACITDENMQASIEKDLNKILYRIYQTVDDKHAVKLWVDGSYNPKTKTSGIGIMIITDERYGFDNVHNIAFGKTVNAKSALTAEIYGLSIGLSYLLDTFDDLKDVHVYYDCVNATICATNIDAYVMLGAPYTNFKSALKRVKRRKINVLFEHTKAHTSDDNNILCDLIARYYSKAKLQNSQIKQIQKIIKK